ncbi:MAG: hypothetical protein HY320_00505 [Armatimonadetes bacterium]|nr:hypothetical protein [Armatimonadota bacterium]
MEGEFVVFAAGATPRVPPPLSVGDEDGPPQPVSPATIGMLARSAASSHDVRIDSHLTSSGVEPPSLAQH